MTYGYDIEYAGASAESIGMYVVKRPDIPAPDYDMETIIIPGRDGVLLSLIHISEPTRH